MLLAWANLRGIREAGRIFAIPTYVYVTGLAAMILYGLFRSATGTPGTIHYAQANAKLLDDAGQPLDSITLFLVLRVRGRHNGAHRGRSYLQRVAAFRRPQAGNAKQSLLVMAFIMCSLFVGISYLARRWTPASSPAATRR